MRHPAIAGLTVHFKVWDVDDPFDQLRGQGSGDEIVGVELVDGDQSGPVCSSSPGCSQP